MKILSNSDIRALDRLAISEEGISSYELMERASIAFTNKFIEDFPSDELPIYIFCGTGNNGGDGLAIARLLRDRLYEVQVFTCMLGSQWMPDASTNYKKLQTIDEVKITTINKNDEFPTISNRAIIIDAILGSGTDRPLSGYWKELVAHISKHSNPIVAVDQSTGLLIDEHGKHPAMCADYTYSFQLPKLGFFLADYQDFVGNWSIIDIGINHSLISRFESHNHLITNYLLHSIYKKRSKYAHKGNFGHALLISGSHGFMGAAVLASEACVRSGAGKTTTFCPKCGYDILQSCIPEVMVSIDKDDDRITDIIIKKDTYQAIGIGPGIGRSTETQEALSQFIASYEDPIVIDADALYALSENPGLLDKIPHNSLLTPHVGEFDRLFGPSDSAYQRLLKQVAMARKYQVVIVLKGAHTSIVDMDGSTYFNNSGNPGMATGGAGDVLTGILTGLMAQGYTTLQSAILGVYLHGLSGDLAMENESEESLMASDLNNYLGRAFKSIST